MGDNMVIDPVIVLSSIFLDDKSTQSTVDSIFNKVCLLFFKFATIHIDLIFVLSFSLQKGLKVCVKS